MENSAEFGREGGIMKKTIGLAFWAIMAVFFMSDLAVA
jgi:hypothetical protein